MNKIARDLALDLLAGPWTREELFGRVNRHLCGRAQRARHFLVVCLLTHAPAYPPSHKLRALFDRIEWVV